MEHIGSGRFAGFLIAVLGIVAVSGLYLFPFWPQNRVRTESFLQSRDDGWALQSLFEAADNFRNFSPVYPYSVVPGGVHTLKSLREVVYRDHVVARHYSDLNLKTIRFIAAPEQKYAFVSYRIKDKVFWTKKRVRIPRGEMLITDGSHSIRTRCGNRISYVPLTPTSPSEPSTLEAPPVQFIPQLPTPFDPVSIPPEVAVPISPTITGPEVPLNPAIGGLFPPVLIPEPPIGSNPPIVLPPAVPGPEMPTTDRPIATTVPEPHTLFMVASGLLFGICWLRRKASKS